MNRDKKVQKEEYELIKKQYLENSNDISICERYAESCYNIDKFKDAIKVYEELVVKSPGTSKYNYRLGKVYFAIEEFEKALEQQQLAIKKWDDFNWSKLEKIKCLMKLGKLQELPGLIDELESKIVDIKEDELLYKNLLKTKVEYFENLKKYDIALTTCKKLIELDNKDGYSHYSCGKINLEYQKYEDALSNFEEADSLLNQAYVKDKIAKVLAYLNRKQDAVQTYKKIPYNKMENYICQHFGRLYLSMNDFDNAKLQLKNAVLKDGKTVAKSHYYLGLVYEKLNLYKNALNEYSIAQELKKSVFNKDYIEAIERINFIKDNITINENEVIEAYEVYTKNIMLDMQTGIVEKFFSDRGFGFINADSNKKYFFHIKNCIYKNPIVHDKVKFELIDGKKGKEAVRVELLAK